MIIEKQSAAEVGQYGYTHYCKKPVSVGQHEMALVPQSIADGWQGFCTCGEWSAFASFYEFPTRESLFNALNDVFKRHASTQTI